MGVLPTVKIKHPDQPGDFMIVNERDFNPARHERWGKEASGDARVPEGEGYAIEPKAGGWYAIVVDGKEVAKVRKADLEAKLAELGLAE